MRIPADLALGQGGGRGVRASLECRSVSAVGRRQSLVPGACPVPAWLLPAVGGRQRRAVACGGHVRARVCGAGGPAGERAGEPAWGGAAPGRPGEAVSREAAGGVMSWGGVLVAGAACG